MPKAMTLEDQAARRVALALEIHRQPLHWIATAEAARAAGTVAGKLIGLPVNLGEPRSDWGLELVLARR